MDRTPNDLLPASKEDAELIGSKHYFDGVPCKNGHIEKRRTKCKSCIQCIRNASAKYKLTEKYAIGAAKRIDSKKADGTWSLDCASRTLKHQYGITLEEYNKMLEKQQGVCAICGKAEKITDKRTGNVKRLAVDHCHKTNVIRGLLCLFCNTAIGKFKDNPELIEKAASYVRNKGELNCQ